MYISILGEDSGKQNLLLLKIRRLANRSQEVTVTNAK
jgi:hypothetical protein